MGRSEIEAPLLVDENVESQVLARMSRVNEDYVALPFGPAAAAESQEGLGYVDRNRRNGMVMILATVCCVTAILFMSAALGSYNSRLEIRGGLTEDSSNEDGETNYYRASESHTGYHFQPVKNWMNDPDAPMSYKGYYHFFYQYNPDGAMFGVIAWGHAASTDLITWLDLDIALKPDMWYDSAGVWSGSATILEDGTPVIVYTGGQNAESGEAVQSQNVALPVDPSDPLLMKWKKVDANPIIHHPENILSGDFRDPTTAWLEGDGFWRLSIGTKRDNADGSKDGFALLYKSIDFSNWEMEETHLHDVPGSGMWECVDFYPISVQGKTVLNQSVVQAEKYLDSYKYVLKASLDVNLHDYYTIGTYSTETHTFTADDPALDLGHGPRYDYGKFYASKTFFDPSTGRRILWGWANESDSQRDDVLKGWASVQAIPRTVWLDGLTLKNVLQWPVEEVEALRETKATYQNIGLQPTDVLKVLESEGAQLDVVIVFEKPDVSTAGEMISDLVAFDCSNIEEGSAHRGVFGPFGLLVHADDALTEHTGVFFYITPLKDGLWATLVCSDQSRSSLTANIDKTVYGSSVTVQPDEKELSLRILLDHSIVEVFVQGGRLAITSRVYPTKAIGFDSHLFLFNNGTTPIRVISLDVYKMRRVNT